MTKYLFAQTIPDKMLEKITEIPFLLIAFAKFNFWKGDWALGYVFPQI